MPDHGQVTHPDVPTHPEEISASFDMRVGKHITLQGRARITPAGVVCGGIAVAIMTLAAGALVASLRRRQEQGDGKRAYRSEMAPLGTMSPSSGGLAPAPSRKRRNASRSAPAALFRKNAPVSIADSFSATATLMNWFRLVPSADAIFSAALFNEG